jgi:hypothetical protein
MKKIFLSAVFVIATFISNAQVVTISGFGTKEKFGPVDSKTEFDKILFDKYDALPSEDLPVGYKYVINFATKQCTLYDGNGEFVVTVIFKVIDKKSDQDFQIEFTDNDLEDDYGIIVKDTVAAHTQYNGKAVFLTIFDAMYIF